MSSPSESVAKNIGAWLYQDMLFEQYTYTSGRVTPIPTHSHVEYQTGLSFDKRGQYHYRGEYHTIPPSYLSIIHTGEAHAPSREGEIITSATFWMAYVLPETVAHLRAQMKGRTTSSLPYFHSPAISDPDLTHTLLKLIRVLEAGGSQLEQDDLFLLFLSNLIERHADDSTITIRPVNNHPAIRRARDFLVEHYDQNLSLQTLADIADLSIYYFAHAFRREFGLPPHVFQTQVRIDRAKSLLVAGLPLAAVASTVGFYDQSHFGLHFKRLVGVAPGKYARLSSL